MRYLLFCFLFFSSPIFAQRDSVINGINCHLISENPDTGSAWIQKKIVKKSKAKAADGAAIFVTKFSGVYFEVYPGGKLKAKGYFKRGKRNEKWIRYYLNGQKKEEGYFDGGYKSDLWMTYYESGKMSWKGNFYKNMRAGFWRYFYESGQLKSMTRYRIKTESIAKRPKTKTKGWSFLTSREITYSISPADSLVEYYPDGKLRTRIIYGKDGGLNGAVDFYYPDGKHNLRGQYTNGKESGTWVWYCTDGVQKKTIDYSAAAPADAAFGVVCTYEAITPWMKWQVEMITS
jgi:antitoxin component YwqK of YwqJK toxin-antitoxin module